MKLDYIRKTAPGFFDLSGGYQMECKPYSDATANGLTKCIYDFITHSGGYCNRISTTGTIRKINGEMKWTTGNTNKGAFDLRFVYQSKSGDIEIKIGRDRLSDAQLKEMDRISLAGGLVFIARDFPSFLEWWQSIGFEIPELELIKSTLKNSL